MLVVETAVQQRVVGPDLEPRHVAGAVPVEVPRLGDPEHLLDRPQLVGERAPDVHLEREQCPLQGRTHAGDDRTARSIVSGERIDAGT
jgi:hypothetical protein